MKKLKFILSMILVFFSISLWSQVSINTDASKADTSAMLDVKSTFRGFLMPRMTTAQRLNIYNPAAGLCVFDTDLNTFCYHNGTQWLPFGSGADYDWIINGNNMYSNVSGNVGIGSTNPAYKLTIDAGDVLIKGDDGWSGPGDDARLYLGDSYNGISAVYTDGLRLWAYNNSDNDIRFRGHPDVDFMTIKMLSGYVGIGTTNPSYLLDVAGPINLNRGVATGIALRINGSSVIEHFSDYYKWGGNKMNYFWNWVGIGISSPSAALHITGPAAALRGQLCITDNSSDNPFMSFYQGSTFKSFIGCVGGVAQISTMDGSHLALQASGNSGNVGIGVLNPSVTLEVRSKATSDAGIIVCGNSDLSRKIKLWSGHQTDPDPFLQWKEGGSFRFATDQSGWSEKMRITSSGNVGIGVLNPASKLDVKGNITVRDGAGNIVVELGTGLDYAEGFNLSVGEEILPGTVLVIDPENPGKLMVSECAYDSKVAGIVAGANGLGSGIKLGVELFDCDVALAGRVFCNVDATNSAVEPGDLLTTSDIYGYAMKAQDPFKIHGAILGKAMESLEKGKKGQILVLVTLQ